MNESELTPNHDDMVNDHYDWDIDDIIEQILTEFNGTVTRSTVLEVLKEIVPIYENARVRTFVPIFIRQDAINRLRSMPSPGADLKEIDSDPSPPRIDRDDGPEPIAADLAG